MTTGIRLYNTSGVSYFSTDAQTWNYIGSFIASANQSTSVSFANLAIMSEVIFQRSAVDNAPSNQQGYIHNVSRVGTTVTATAGTGVGTIRTLVIVLGR